MRQRLVGWAAVLGLVTGVVGIGLVAVATGGGGKPRPLQVQLGAAGTERAAAGIAADMAFPARYVEYRVEGTLPELDDEARAWSLGRDGDAERVAALAQSLGLDGEVEADGSGWTVADGEHHLRVERAPGLPWFYGPGVTTGGVECAAAGRAPADEPVSSGESTSRAAEECRVVEAAGGGAGASGGTVATAVPYACPPCPAGADCAPCARPAPTATPDLPTRPAPAAPDGCPMPPCPEGAACTQSCPGVEPPAPPPDRAERPADLPTRAEAERIGRGVLAEAGLELEGATVRVEDGFSQWFVAASPVVGGLPTVGWEWGVGVGPKGVVEHAHGYLAPPEPGDLYPLVGVARGVERLKTGFGFGGGPVPLGAEPALDAPAIARECPPNAECLAPEPPEPVVRTITGVRLGLLFTPVWGDRAADEALLVPAYLFDVDDGGTVPVAAVTDEFLPQPPAPEPRPGPAPAPLPAPDPDGQQCSGSASSAAPPADGGDVNQPVTVEACGPSRARVGEEVAFSLTAYDPDALIVTGDCGGPRATFGDETGQGECIADCAPFDPPPAKEGGKHGERFTHVYEKPGTYTVTFRVRSGSPCDGHPWGDVGEVSLQVVVAE